MVRFGLCGTYRPVHASRISSSQSAEDRASVRLAIADAANRTGTSFSYLFNQAKSESGLNPNAKAGNSSATGLYQFIDQSWLATVKKHGAEHGLGWAADSISQGRDGRYHVADAATKAAVLGLRTDPDASASMAAEYAADNKNYLEKRLGREIESVDLYMAHFLGPAGARRFLAGMDANPGASAADVLPAAARANRSIFYDKAGQARSFADIRQRFAVKFEGDTPTAPQPASDGLPRVELASLDALEGQQALQQQNLLTPSPQYARLAYLMLANLGG